MPEEARYRELLDRAEEIGGLGAWDWCPQTGELHWSDNHFRLFGLEPQSHEASVELVLDRTHPDDRDRVARTVAELDPEDGIQDLEYRIVRADGTIRHLRVTVSVVERDGDTPTRIVGSVQDITERRVAERTIAARIAVSEVLDRWESLDRDALALLARLGEAMQFGYGALMLKADGHLVVVAAWHAGSDELEAVAAAGVGLRRSLGGSDTGRAWTSREPVIAPFVPAERTASAFRDAVEAAGVRATVAIPAVAGDTTLAVLGFLSSEALVPTEQLVRPLTGIGHELGHFFRSRRGELERPVLTPRELEVLQLAARGGGGPAIARELQVSPATVKRHFEGIYARLQVSDRAAAVAEAMRRGLID
ncbi:MAG: diguanylate cyclase with sensor [Solirubrobacteraceae bacterium]|nr:diguanylate cyclase with sensor [Solirubrobacteraceae bacterium]